MVRGIQDTLARAGYTPLLVNTDNDPEVEAHVVASLRDIEDVLARIRRAYLVAIPLLLAAAAAGGYFMARRSLSPVSAMGARAAAITDANLHERLPVVTSSR